MFLRLAVTVGPMSNTQWYSLSRRENIIIMREFTQLASCILQYCDDIFSIHENATTTAIKLLRIRDITERKWKS